MLCDVYCFITTLNQLIEHAGESSFQGLNLAGQRSFRRPNLKNDWPNLLYAGHNDWSHLLLR